MTSNINFAFFSCSFFFHLRQSLDEYDDNCNEAVPDITQTIAA